MATTRSIATTFTLNGIEAIKKGLTRIVDMVRSFVRTIKSAVVGLFDGAINSVKKLVAAIKNITFKDVLRGAKLVFKGIAVAAAAAAVKIGAISLAALKATDDMADYLHMINTLHKQTGASSGDIAALRYAAEAGGGDPEELLPTLSNIAGAFGDIKTSIDQANDSYAKTRSWARSGLIASLKDGDFDGAVGFLDQTAAARVTSLQGIEDRKAQIFQELNRIEDTDPGFSGDKLRLNLVSEYKSLEDAEDGIKQGFGPAGQALEKLREQGLDMDKALKGGLDTMYALADALEKIPDSDEKLRIAGQLFGGDSGPKNLALLQGGRKGIDSYKQKMSEYGALPTDEDAAAGTAYKQAKLRWGLAIQGVKLNIFRELAPMIQEGNDQIGDFISKNRERIAGLFKDTFIEVRKTFFDVVRWLEGDTTYESWLFKKLADIKKWVQDCYAYLQDCYSYVLDLAALTYKEIQAVMTGHDSDWAWLNWIKDAFVAVKSFATDAYSVITGGNADTYQWMNVLRDQVVDFGKKVVDAFNMFADAIKTVHAFLQPIFAIFGTDVTTGLLFMTMMRFSGLLSIIFKTIGFIGRGILLFFGGIGTGAAGAVTAIGAIVTAFTPIAALLAGFGITYAAGRWVQNKEDEGWNALTDKTAELIRVEGDRTLDAKLDNDPVFRHNYYEADPRYHDALHTMTYDERQQEIQDQLTKRDALSNLGLGALPNITRSITFNIGARATQLYGGDDADSLADQFSLLQRQGY